MGTSRLRLAGKSSQRGRLAPNRGLGQIEPFAAKKRQKNTGARPGISSQLAEVDVVRSGGRFGNRERGRLPVAGATRSFERHADPSAGNRPLEEDDRIPVGSQRGQCTRQHS